MAHRTKEQAIVQGDEIKFRGNDLADILAKQAASWGSGNIVEVVAALDIVEGWKHFHIFVGKMLKKWLPMWSKPMEKPIRIVEPRMDYQHALTYNTDYNLWHCTSCLRNFRKKQSATTKPCDQLASHMLAVIVQAQECGHNVWICNMAEANDKLMYCNRCGCYAQVKPDGLLKRCKATASSQRQRLENFIMQGKHSTTGAILGKPRLVPICTQSLTEKGRSIYKAKLDERRQDAENNQRIQVGIGPANVVQKPLVVNLVELGKKADQGQRTREISEPIPHFANRPAPPVGFEGHFEDPPWETNRRQP